MKKKILTVALVCAMMSAAAITANAAPITPQTADPKNGSTDVSYQVDPTYTITIPESVTLSKDSTVNANITAADVLLENGKKITVTLTGASNTTGEGTDTFNAKNNESVATYTIAAGNNSVALGGEVASFTTDGTQDLTFSVANTTGVIYAGAHTETLTFTIGVEAAATQKTFTISAPAGPSVTITYTTGQKWGEIDLPDGWSFSEWTGFLSSGDWFIQGNNGPIEAGDVIDETLNYYLYKD